MIEGKLALSLSIFESIIIVYGYISLWYDPVIVWYTEFWVRVHTAINFLVNVPLIIILCIYFFDNQGDELMFTFYFALITYIVYGLYRFYVNRVIFGNKYGMEAEPYFYKWIWSFAVSFAVTMIGLIVIAILNFEQHETIAIVFIALSVVGLVGLCVWLKISEAQKDLYQIRKLHV